MRWWERIRSAIAGLIWPEAMAMLKERAGEVDSLKARLETVHRRMRDLYWDGKDREYAESRIAVLEEALRIACSVLYVSGEEESARLCVGKAGISWSSDSVDSDLEKLEASR